MPGVPVAYKLPEHDSGGMENPFGATVFVPGHVDPPTAAPLEEASWENGLLSAKHPAHTGEKVGVPVKQPSEVTQLSGGRRMTGPSRRELVDVSLDRDYQLRAVEIEPVSSQHMITPKGQPVTQVNYTYDYEVHQGTVFTVNGISVFGHSPWKPVSTENVSRLVSGNGVAAANIPSRRER